MGFFNWRQSGGARRYATQTAADYDLKACISSHAGDGNLHLNIVGKMQDKEFVERLNRAYDQIVSFAISKGGTATGEHGVGIGKRKFMQQEHGFGIEIMRSIKQCFDPKGILNPGKIFPWVQSKNFVAIFFRPIRNRSLIVISLLLVQKIDKKYFQYLASIECFRLNI